VAHKVFMLQIVAYFVWHIGTLCQQALGKLGIGSNRYSRSNAQGNGWQTNNILQPPPGSP